MHVLQIRGQSGSYLTSLITLFVLICGCDDSPSSTEIPADTSISGAEDIVGSIPAGEISSGEIAEGGMATGGLAEGGMAEGGMAAGEMAAGEMAEGGMAAGAMTAGEMTAGESAIECGLPRSRDQKLVAVGFPFNEEIGTQGTDVGVYHLTNMGEVSLWGPKINLGYRPMSLRFSEDGQWLVALGEGGEVSTIDLRGELPILHFNEVLIDGYFSTVQPSGKHRQFDLVDRNNNDTAGIYQFNLTCEGEAILLPSALILRLIQGFARFSADSSQAIIFGGQALFDPIDLIDLRWMSNEGDEWSLVTSLDVFEDSLDAINVGLSPDHRWVAMVNGSPFTDEGGQVRVIEVIPDPPQLIERQRLEGYFGVRGAWFSRNGQTLMITQLEEGAVQLFQLQDDTWVPDEQLRGIGLAEHLVLTDVDNGSSTLVIIPSTSPAGGSHLSMFTLDERGQVLERSAALLGSGILDIPGAVAVWPEVKPTLGKK